MSEHGAHTAHHHEETKHAETRKKKTGSTPRGEQTEAREKREDRRAGRFPVGGLILTVVLIAVILAAGYAGILCYEQYGVIKAEHDAVVNAANAELAGAQAEYAIEDPDSEAHIAERQALSEEILREAKEEMARMEQEKGALDRSIAAAEDRVRELESQEDFDYFKSVYDEYVEGREYVEELLSTD